MIKKIMNFEGAIDLCIHKGAHTQAFLYCRDVGEGQTGGECHSGDLALTVKVWSFDVGLSGIFTLATYHGLTLFLKRT